MRYRPYEILASAKYLWINPAYTGNKRGYEDTWQIITKGGNMKTNNFTLYPPVVTVLSVYLSPNKEI